MTTKYDDEFKDVHAETNILAGVFRHGRDAFIDVDDFVDPDMLGVDLNRYLLAIVKEHYKDATDRPLDYATLMGHARRLGLDQHLDTEDAKKHVRSLYRFDVALDTVRPEAAKILKLNAAKNLDEVLRQGRRRLRGVTGDESLAAILAMVEGPLSDFSASFDDGRTEGPVKMSEGGSEWLEHVVANPVENIGIPSPFPTWNEQTDGIHMEGVTLFGARMKVGKDAPLDTLIYTPCGPKRMGDMVVGDVVSTPDGRAASVIGVFPQGERDVYRIVFSDGDSTECGFEHLWRVKHVNRKHYEVKTTREIMATMTSPNKAMKRGFAYNWHVQLPQSCHYDEKPVLMDPYLMGYLVGNGSFTSGGLRVTIPDQETVDRLNGILKYGYRLRLATNCRNGIDYTITNGKQDTNPYLSALGEYGLKGRNSHTKFVPDAIKYNSVEVRWAFLNGWLDADGGVTVNANGTTPIEGSTASKQLARDLKELIQSLGGLCSVTPRVTHCEGKPFDSFRLAIRFNDASRCFVLSRKKSLIRNRTKGELRRLITSVEFVGRKPTQCIMVDSAEHLYMTDHHIVTHNTHLADNLCLHVAGTLGIPVLNVDREMTRKQHLARVLANITNIDSRRISKGKVTAEEAEKLRAAIRWLDTIPYYYESVIDKSFEQQIAGMRRWCVKHVPVGEDGVRGKSMILYDYLKVCDEGDLNSSVNESQRLGYMMMSLLRLAAKSPTAVVSMIQLNREGDDKESSTVVFGSDRPAQSCVSFTILKKKTEAELEDDGRENGTHKLVNVMTRFGEGGDGNYISLHFDGSTSRISEGKTNHQIRKERGARKSTEETFEVPKKFKKARKTAVARPETTADDPQPFGAAYED